MDIYLYPVRSDNDIWLCDPTVLQSCVPVPPSGPIWMGGGIISPTYMWEPEEDEEIIEIVTILRAMNVL